MPHFKRPGLILAESRLIFVWAMSPVTVALYKLRKHFAASIPVASRPSLPRCINYKSSAGHAAM